MGTYMKKGIVITTSFHTREWLPECVRTSKGKYPVLIVSNSDLGIDMTNYEADMVVNDWNGFELGGILQGKEHFDEFIHLMDTTIIKDVSLFDKLFDIDGHVFLTKGGYHYMGKFVSKDLPEIPKISTKEEAINQELYWLGDKPRTYFTPDLPAHTGVFEEKHGRTNMVLENDYLIKYKATFRI